MFHQDRPASPLPRPVRKPTAAEVDAYLTEIGAHPWLDSGSKRDGGATPAITADAMPAPELRLLPGADFSP